VIGGENCVKKKRLLLISIILFAACLISWQLGNYYSAPGEMDEGTSFAIIGSLGTVFFLFTTVILSLVAFISKKKGTR
jgi:hypothetical protein